MLGLLSLALLVCGYINFEQRRLYQLPTDGVTWADSDQGVMAWIVARGGPADRAGIQEGDRLLSINGMPILHAQDAAHAVFALGVWSETEYDLARDTERFRASVVIAPQTNTKPIRRYLELLGVLYLGIGAFILIRRWSATRSVHFYTFCLASFVLYTFSYTGKLNLFDWSIYWLNVVAWIVQPALFLHFCLSFPERPAWLRQRSWIIPSLYGSGVLLLAFHVLVSLQVIALPVSLQGSRWLLDRLDHLYMVAGLLGGAVVLERSYRRARVPLIKQQLKWVTRGAFLAIVPFGTLYAVPYFLGFVPTPWMAFSVFSLAFLPLTFGYAIMHYRLMDVDIIFRRGIAYTLATAALVGVYFGFIALFADYFRNHVGITSHSGWILAVIVTAILFQPVVNWIQERLDRFFRRERYNYRSTLLEFARDLTAELHVGRLLDQVTEHLAETLDVDRIAVFLAAEADGFRLVKSRGVTYAGPLDLTFLDPTRPELSKGYLFFSSVWRPLDVSAEARAAIQELELHYYLPFKVKDRTLGYLGLGKTRSGDFLSSEDVDLLRTIASSVSIALENARLYESLEQRALQYQTLKDFSENIIESINAGVAATNLTQEIEAWNSGMETLYGIDRSHAVGRRLGEVFPADLLSQLPQVSDATHQVFSLYKFRLNNAAGRQLIVNLSATPLLGKDGRVLGRLLIFTDLTERVSLEDRLAQAEKLSSIGLLSAGIAHEVNTPLAVITAQAQMLLRQIPADDPRRPTLEKIIKASFRASEIVNNLLKFSRVSGSEYAELDLNRVVRETLSLLDPMLRTSKVGLNLQLSKELPPVFGNYGKLQQVLMNLIMNARDAMPRGGELTLSTECENSHVQVEVADNGVGIAPDHLNKIFDPFFTTKSTSRGTGLGLAVTYGIIREHSGEIRVESALGRGTTFRLEFPAARKAVNVS